MILTALAVTLAATTVAIPANRFTFWISWSWPWALIGILGTAVITAGVSIAGLAVAGAASGHQTLSAGQAAIAAGTAQTSLRRGGSRGRGSTLALGLVHWWLEIVDTRISDAISSTFAGLPDNDLVNAAGRLDLIAQGAKTALDVRVKLRRERVAQMQSDPHWRQVIRDDLVHQLVSGYRKYQLRKPDGL